MITLHKFLKAMLLSLDLVSGYILKISNFRSFQNQDFHFIIKGLQVLLKTQLITSYFCLSANVTIQMSHHSTWSLSESRDQCTELASANCSELTVFGKTLFREELICW